LDDGTDEWIKGKLHFIDFTQIQGKPTKWTDLREASLHGFRGGFPK
jgi:hypothetical protein